MTSPTQKTLGLLKNQGYICGVVEKWNPFAKVRQDLFGVIDILAVHKDGRGVLGVQTTTKSNMAARINKALASDKLPIWLMNGNYFVVHGWEKKGNRYVMSLREIKIREDKSGMYLEAVS